MMGKTYCYMDQKFYKLFVKAWNFRGTLQSLSRHTNVPRHTVWDTLIYSNQAKTIEPKNTKTLIVKSISFLILVPIWLFADSSIVRPSLFLWGKGTWGTSKSRNLHRGSQPSETLKTSSFSFGASCKDGYVCLHFDLFVSMKQASIHFCYVYASYILKLCKSEKEHWRHY